jgi:hypothetical protein
VAAGSADFLAWVEVCPVAGGRRHAITQALVTALSHPARIGIKCLNLTTSPDIPANKQAQPGTGTVIISDCKREYQFRLG